MGGLCKGGGARREKEEAREGERGGERGGDGEEQVGCAPQRGLDR